MFKKYTIIIGTLIFAAVVGPVFSYEAHAARLFFDPEGGAVYRGDEFTTLVRIDTEGECINTIEADIQYPQDTLTAVDVGRGSSFLTLWVEDPRINRDEGTISFAGGVPGGYCGKVPGDTGESDVVLKLVFRIPSFSISEDPAQEVEIDFNPETTVLLNDGVGSAANLSLGSAVYEIEDGGELESEWDEELRNDATSPEAFILEIQRDPDILNGKYFIVFSTTDKQTGIDHYEVLESDEKGFVQGTNRKAEWVVARSPYVLQDQDLKSIIKVRAVDKAGNETIAQYIPESLFSRIRNEIAKWERQRVMMGLLLAGIILLFLIYIGIRFWMDTKSKKQAR